MSQYTDTLQILDELVYKLSHKANAAPLATLEGLVNCLEMVAKNLKPSDTKTELYAIYGLMKGVIKENRTEVDEIVKDIKIRVDKIKKDNGN